jgi:uncharacterized protein YbcI
VSGTPERAVGQHLRQAIADAVVRSLQEHTGRGATRARTVLGSDAVIVFLEDSLTRGERTLIACGSDAEVLRIRRAFQEAMKPDLIAIVEDLTGRTVMAFMSANHLDPDCSAEIFLLAPEPSSS